MRFLPVLIVFAILLSTTTASAQKNKRDETEKAYRQLRQSFQPQDGAKGTNPQEVQREKTRSVETWIKRNDWKELSVKDQAWLCDTMSGPDQVDKKAFSVRWTGMLRAPATGSYTFSQLAIPGAEGFFRLWLDDQLVLDNAAESEKEDDEAAVQKSKPSGAVALTAGKPVAFRLDYVRAPVVAKPGVMRIPGFPAAVLAWRSDVMEQQVVPASVFFIGTESKEMNPGLKAEYFADTTLTKRVADRIDSDVDFMWDVGRVAGEHRSSQREIVASTVAKITAPGFLNSIDPVDAKNFMQEQLPALFGTMSASERVAVLRTVGERPDLLKYLTFQQMTAALRWYSTMGDSAAAIDFLVKWSKTAPIPQTQPGFVPGRSNGGYLNLNIEPYFRLARLFLGDNVEANIETLLPNTVNEDGSCNLTVTYILCCVCRMADKLKTIAGLMDAHLIGEEAEKLPGDVRATWFLAEAFKYETCYGNDFQPGAGIEPVEKGLKAAQSPEMRFRMITELTARLIAIDQADEARSLIMSVRDQYPDEEKQALLDRWLEKGTELKKYYEGVRDKKSEEADKFAAEEYAKELRRRAVTAEKRGEKETLGRYRKTITAIEERQAELQKKQAEPVKAD